ncbi:unnamed protein product [Arabidopsis lyrata]|uniref:uncharacterized protein LOC9299630 isoform X1 n=1 Tax=Arabidopsis lyrata subsp. lyrata TaxID=81972 RepID=UPI000A29C95E|nr:uncharacterized protein LOC9299630 isoform X1 [Arabidopsis lyrata subsp. lyrata]XP_020891059.1 uncharacterized protein LOC9299630 isoform X1 [Arabidopsis lyrata subsp. lyrata]XP_020891061.1 uncharacterized protein LOC9299630 isoform X1 [Arabidopsis lyrata subsp. lyrata]CAH8278334.1 unnamed protein product [Arabidopsis lyrata]|eukprot:XP_020891054.1 uncharacterized protein LOC9299630 isoform X1 [Arabidopsis lyrata subsp. lyrata]
MVAAVLMPMVSFRDESSRENWQVISRNDSKKKILVKQTSMLQSEREISMDPKSIRSLSFSGSLRRNDSFDMIRLPAMSPPRDLDAPMAIPLQPVQTKFVSRSHPNSTFASPRKRSGLMRALRNKEQDSLPNSTSASPRKRSGLMRALRNKEQDSLSNSTSASPKQRSGLMRALRNKEQDSLSNSTSASPKQRSGLMRALRNKEQDSLSNSTSASPKQRSGLMRALRNKEQDSLSNSTSASPKQRSGLMRALRNKEQDSLPNSTSASPKQRSGLMRALRNKEQDSSSASYKRSKSCGSTSKRLSLKSSGIRNSVFIKTESNKSISNNNTLEDGFRCNALCLYLPGFSKEKPIKSSRKDDSSSFTRTTTMTRSSSSTITVSRTVSVRESTTTTTVISARASMEKFDCGSYTSEAVGEEGGNHFFDLPSELIKTGSGDNDHDEPVSAAFVFDKEPVEKEIKGVLKVSGSSNRKSMESSSLRQVRFSTSSPVSYPTSPAISPRLLEATKNFNAFLEAQAV